MTVLVNEVAIHEQKGLAGGNAKFLGLFRGSFGDFQGAAGGVFDRSAVYLLHDLKDGAVV